MKKIIVSIFVLMLMITGCSTSSPSEDPKVDGTVIKVGTWNIGAGGFSEPEEMRDQIIANDLELVGMQEIDVFNERNNVDQLAAFKSDEMPYIHWAKGRDFANGGFGLGTVSKLPFVETSSIPMETSSSRATKILERVVVEKDGKKISFYNLHTSWETMDLRKRQFVEVMQRVDLDPNPYKIIVGDFNADQYVEEYQMYLEDYKLSNGKDGHWIETFPDKEADPAMQVYSIDNIIVTKNINILDVKEVVSNKSDHLLLMANLELTDETVETAAIKNVALGRTINADSNFTGNIYNLVDYSDNSGIVLDGEEHSFIVDLAHLYDIDNVEVVFDHGSVVDASVALSADKANYTDAGKFSVSDNKLTLTGISKDARYVKVNVELEEGKTLALNEIKVLGKPVIYAGSKTQILKDPNFENTDVETLQTTYNNGWNVSTSVSNLADHLKKITDGITIENLDEGNFVRLYQHLKLQPNRVYVYKFDLAGTNVDSAEFAFGVDHIDRNGNSIFDYKTRMINNLNVSEDSESFVYTFTTSPEVEHNIVSLEILNTLGKFEIKNFEVYEGVRIQQVFLEVDKREIKVGDTLKVNANILPVDANDFNLEWKVSDETIATINDAGELVAKAKGEVMVSLISKENLILESSILIKID